MWDFHCIINIEYSYNDGGENMSNNEKELQDINEDIKSEEEIIADGQETRLIDSPDKFYDKSELESEIAEEKSDSIDEPIVEEYTESEYIEDDVDNAENDATTYIDASKVEEELELREAEEELKEMELEKVEQRKEAAGNILGRVFGCFGNLLFVLFILAMSLIIVMNGVSFVKGKEPSILGYKMYVIGEDSMSPTIKRNDAIIVKETTPSELKVGDLITYSSKSGNEVITGWVTEIFDGNRFEVKKKMSGDQAVIIDGVAVIGLAIYKIASMGEFIEYISHPIGIASVLIVGIVIYVIIWLIGRRKSKQA